MGKSVRYRTGLVLDGMYCSFCGARRTGTIYQEGARWMAKLHCGHLGFRGWTQDPEELERLGLINKAPDKPDPRAEMRQRQEQEDRYREAQEKLDFELRQASKRGEIK